MPEQDAGGSRTVDFKVMLRKGAKARSVQACTAIKFSEAQVPLSLLVLNCRHISRGTTLSACCTLLSLFAPYMPRVLHDRAPPPRSTAVDDSASVHGACTGPDMISQLPGSSAAGSRGMSMPTNTDQNAEQLPV